MSGGKLIPAALVCKDCRKGDHDECLGQTRVIYHIPNTHYGVSTLCKCPTCAREQETRQEVQT